MRYQDVTLDTSGNAISGVSVTVKNADTGVLTTLYSDNTYASTIPNPQTSGADGSYGFYCKDARVDLSFVKTGYTFANKNDVDCFQPIGDNTKTPADFTTLDISAVTEGAIDKIGATVTTFIVNKPITCVLSDTIPSTCTLIFIGQGDLTVSAGQTLTINGPVINQTDHNVFLGSGTVVFGNNAGSGPHRKKRTALTYSASMTPDTKAGDHHTITITDASAFTINAPTGPLFDGTEIIFTLINSSGGAHGTITWNSVWKLVGGSLAAIANGSNKTIAFRFSGTTNFYESYRSSGDVSN